MTGLKMAGKAGTSETVAVEVGKTSKGERKRSVLTGLVASLATAMLFCAILFGVVFYFQKRLDDKREWISWTRRSGNVDIHETVLLDEEKQTVLIVSAEAYRIGKDNSMTLHDFNMGYVVIRDWNLNVCLVSRAKYPDFSYARKKLQDRQGKNLDLPPAEHAVARPGNMTAIELGPNLSQFCEGVPAIWYDVTSKSGELALMEPYIKTHQGLSAWEFPDRTVKNVRQLFLITLTITWVSVKCVRKRI